MRAITSKELARLHAAELRNSRRAAGGWMARRAARRRARYEHPVCPPADGFFSWVRGLPWVVERPYEVAPGVRTFAVDCPLLGIRRVWLVTGLGSDGCETPTARLSIVVPTDVSWTLESSGWGRPIAEMAADQILLELRTRGAETTKVVETLVLTGYRYAIG